MVYQEKPTQQLFKSNKDLAYWHPCDNVRSIESHGYWILTIDPKTGRQWNRDRYWRQGKRLELEKTL